MSNGGGYDLNLQHYSLDEIFGLFGLTNRSQLSIEEMQRCKRQVLAMHPDKSKLSSEYFLFYKQAFDVILDIYKVSLQTTQPVKAPEAYQPYNNVPEDDHIRNEIRAIKGKAFQEQFHQTFERVAPKVPQRNNDWFHAESCSDNIQVKNVRDVHQSIESWKAKQRQHQLARYQGFQEIRSNTIGGTSFYEDIGDDGTEDAAAAGGGYYIGCDAFSKLKFDDIRRVHKDETVFAVSEQDMANRPTYKNASELEVYRSSCKYEMKENPEEILRLREEEWRRRMTQKAFESKKRTMEAEAMNKQVLSQFLRLQDK